MFSIPIHMMKKVITRKSRKYYRNLKSIEHRRKTREELVSLGKCEFGKVKNSLVKVRTVLEVNKRRKQEKGCSGYKTSHSKIKGARCGTTRRSNRKASERARE